MIRSITLFTALMAAPAFAQETVGSMDGTLEGRQVSYIVIDGDDVDTGWSETDDGIEVILNARPADSTGDDAPLTVTFVADAASRTAQVVRGDVTLTRDSDELTATDDAINLMLDSLEVQDDSLLVVGNLRATMGESEADISVASPAAITLSIDVQATVIRSDD